MNNRHTKTLLVFAVLFLFLLTSAFTGGQKEGAKAGKTTLQFASWLVAEASGGDVWLPERIKAWEKMNPNVSVEIVPIGWEDTPDKIALQTQANNVPDIFTIESLWLGKIGKMPGAVEDLNKYMTPEFTSTLVPAYKGGELEGKMVGLVWNPNPWVLVYNKDLVKRAGVSGKPQDSADFLRQVNAVDKVRSNLYGVGLQLGIDEYSADTLHILMWQTGGDMLDSSGRSVVNSPGTIETVKIVKDLVDREVVPFGEDTRNLRTLFAANQIGFFFEGPWIAGVLDGEGMARDEWDVSTWPGKVQPASHILCIAKGSKNKDLAWDLIKFIVTDEITTKEYFKRTGLMPLVKTQYNDPIYSNDYAKTFLAQMSQLKNPNVWSSQKKFEIEIAFMEDLQKILLGRGAVEATLNKLNDRIEKIIAR